MKTVDMSNTIALEMDRVLNDEKNQELFSNASVLEKLAFKKVSEEDKQTEVEAELENSLSKTASAEEVVEAPEASFTADDCVDVLLQVSATLDEVGGFERLAAASAMLAEKLVVEAKAKNSKKDSKKSDKKDDKKSKDSKKSDKKDNMKARMEKMRAMKGKGKKDSKKDSKSTKSSK
jgi:hypothetical protein